MKITEETGNAWRKSAVATEPPNIRQILATTDFSDESRAGVRYAVALAEKLNAAVALLHVFEPPLRFAGMEAMALNREDFEVGKLVPVLLKKLAESESRGDLRLTSSVRTGKPFHEITTAARESAADLVVIATHGYTGVDHVMLGSTAERVVRHAPCPVLTVPVRITPERTDAAPPFKLRKILVPIDFSIISLDALSWASFLAEQFGAELILLHVSEKFPDIDYLLVDEVFKDMSLPLAKLAEADLKWLAETRSQSTGVNMSAVVRDGRPFKEICHVAETLSVDLIVLTTHGHTGLKRFWLGSTAERVVRRAHCPVLSVRERSRETPR